MSGRGEILAAGGVVLRRRKKTTEVVVVHRPKYDDWSLPKGKLDPGESCLEAALREVAEETGLVCRSLGELGSQSYPQGGSTKRVRFFWMKRLKGKIGERRPDAEVDQVRWVRLRKARTLLTYRRDLELVEKAARKFRKARKRAHKRAAKNV